MSRPDSAAQRPSGESGNLDFLRATAVTIVLVFHTLLFWDLEEVGGLSMRPMGLFGVLLFFVHTTLVLMFSLKRHQAQHPNKPLFSPFMVRRFFRIYPLSIAVVGVILLFHVPQAHLEPRRFTWATVSLPGWVLNFLLMQNLGRAPSVLGPLWSLPYEIQMYTVLPLLFLLANRARSILTIILVWCAAAALYGLAALAATSYLGELIAYAPNFIPGVIAYRLSSRERRIPFRWWPVFLAVLIAQFVFLAGRFSGQAVLLGWLSCLLLGFAIPFFQEVPPGPLRAVSHVIAKYSYGIYLSHYFALWFAFVFCRPLPVVLGWCIFVVLVTALPVIMFHTIESPGIRMGNRVAASLLRQFPTGTSRPVGRASPASSVPSETR